MLRNTKIFKAILLREMFDFLKNKPMVFQPQKDSREIFFFGQENIHVSCPHGPGGVPQKT